MGVTYRVFLLNRPVEIQPMGGYLVGGRQFRISVLGDLVFYFYLVKITFRQLGEQDTNNDVPFQQFQQILLPMNPFCSKLQFWMSS